MNDYQKYRCRLESGKFYHIFNRSIGQIPIFFTDRNRRFFLKRYRDFLFNYVETWAWVLMGNHFHLAIKVREPDINMFRAASAEGTKKGRNFCESGNVSVLIEDQFKRLFSSYAQAFNKDHHRTGSLFEKGFRRLEVRNAKHLIQLVHYIHHNPVHHGFVKQPADWRFSSYGTILSEAQTSLKRAAVLELFESQEEFLSLHSQVIKYDDAWKFYEVGD